MSKYTTELRFICENYANQDASVGYEKVADIIANSREKIFDFEYPIFDENYRSVLETKIIKHFSLREICSETVGSLKMFLDTKMNDIMPYYNKLYESELIEFNPLYDVDLTTDHNKDAKGTGTESSIFNEESEYEESLETNDDNTLTSANKNDHWDMYSETPQGGLTGVTSNEYLTNARHITDDTTGSTQTNNRDIDSTRNGNNTRESTDTRTRNLRDIEDYIQHVKGKTGGVSFSKLLQEFRETFLNIDIMIIKDLNDLFFGLW